MTGQDTRQGELQALAREENLTLPYPAHYICWLEDRGRVVNLLDGTVTFAYPTRWHSDICLFCAADADGQRQGCGTLVGACGGGIPPIAQHAHSCTHQRPT
jgi:hypothetical protein